MSLATELAGRNLVEVDAVELLGTARVTCSGSSLQVNSLVLKEDNLYFISDPSGNIPGAEPCHLGLFHEDTRFLSRWNLTLLNHEPTVLSSQANRVFCNQIDLTTSFSEVGHDIYEHNYIHIRRRQALGAEFVERIRISNYLNVVQRVSFSIRFAADFADMFEVRGAERTRRGTYYRPIISQDRVLLCYRGLDGVLRSTCITFDKAPNILNEHSAEWQIVIAPGSSFLLETYVIPMVEGEKEGEGTSSYSSVYEQISSTYSEWRHECSRLEGDDEFLTSSLAQSVTDLRALSVHYRGQSIVSAGIPWYTTAFGRDSLITSLQTLIVNPNIARDTLLFLARYQGTKTDDFTVEEPGKIMHEIRRGEMARCGEIAHIPYYGTVDATPLFLVLLYHYFAWTGDLELLHQLLPNAERALHWIDAYGDVDGDGLVEYWKFSERGCLHQGWKDSVDGVTFPDGTQPQLPIALVEVQAYVYEARMGMSRLYRALGMTEKSLKMRSQAQALQERIEEKFWLQDLRFYALALDGRKRPIAAITSNPAHLLYSQVVSPTSAVKVERCLMSEEMYSGWGIRTFSARHSAYNPLSYHNGSVWPHDNAMALMGLCHYNLKRSAERIFTDLYEAALHFQYYRLPELFCGMTRQPNDSPVQYPVACTPQAWAAASFFMMLQGLLGIQPDAPRSHLVITNPRLPKVLGELTIHNMRVGQARISLKFSRYNDRTFVNVVEQTGPPVKVTVEWE